MVVATEDKLATQLQHFVIRNKNAPFYMFKSQKVVPSLVDLIIFIQAQFLMHGAVDYSNFIAFREHLCALCRINSKAINVSSIVLDPQKKFSVLPKLHITSFHSGCKTITKP